MKRQVKWPVLVAVGAALLLGLIGFGRHTLGGPKHGSQPLVTVEQLREHNAKAYQGR